MSADDRLARTKHITLLELVDRVLEHGVTLSGDIVLSVADVDLVYVSVRALLASVETARRLAGDALPAMARGQP